MNSKLQTLSQSFTVLLPEEQKQRFIFIFCSCFPHNPTAADGHFSWLLFGRTCWDLKKYKGLIDVMVKMFTKTSHMYKVGKKIAVQT